MSQLIFKIGKQRVVRGLRWALYQGDAPDLEEAGYVCLLRPDENSTQVGRLPNDAPPEARYAVSAAAWLSSCVSTRTVYIERLDHDLYWVVAASANLVESKFDRLCDLGALDELLSEAQQQHLGEDVLVVVHPDVEDLPQTINPDNIKRERFDRLVADYPPERDAKIRKVKGLSARTLAKILVVSGLVVGFAAYYSWTQCAAEQARLAAEALRLEQERQRSLQITSETDLRIQTALTEAASTDTKTPSPSDLVTQCLAALAKHGTRRAGWALERLQCSNDLITTHWQQRLGTNADLLASYQPHGLLPAFNHTQNTAEIAESISISLRPGLDPTSMPDRAFVTDYSTHLQRLNRAYDTIIRVARFEALKQRSITYPRCVESLLPTQVCDPKKDQPTEVPHGQWQISNVQLSGHGAWLLKMATIDHEGLSIQSLSFAPDTRGVKWMADIQMVAR